MHRKIPVKTLFPIQWSHISMTRKKNIRIVEWMHPYALILFDAERLLIFSETVTWELQDTSILREWSSKSSPKKHEDAV